MCVHLVTSKLATPEVHLQESFCSFSLISSFVSSTHEGGLLPRCQTTPQPHCFTHGVNVVFPGFNGSVCSLKELKRHHRLGMTPQVVTSLANVGQFLSGSVDRRLLQRRCVSCVHTRVPEHESLVACSHIEVIVVDEYITSDVRPLLVGAM